MSNCENILQSRENSGNADKYRLFGYMKGYADLW